MASKKSKPESFAEEKAQRQEADTGTILVVDDEASIVEGWKIQLENMGYRVAAFSASQEALKECRGNPGRFDLVITDQNMPGMNGDELIRELRKINSNVPVILVSGLSYKISTETRVVLGINAVLRKPLEAWELEQAIRAVLSEGR